jgi:hypothetical protein
MTPISASFAHRRLLLTLASEPCPFGCTYCFAEFSQYSPGPTLDELEADPRLLDGVQIIYPACDADLFVRRDAAEVLIRTAALRRSISISTKARVRRSHIELLQRLNRELGDFGQLLKVGVSFSNRSRVAEIEPRTPTYERRLETLSRLQHAGIPTIAVIRPLLADIDDGEYEALIADVAPFVLGVLMGDEYLDAQESRRRVPSRIATGPTGVRSRSVNWLASPAVWPVRETLGRITRLSAYAASLGVAAYTSDLQIMDSLIHRAHSQGTLAARALPTAHAS